LEANHPSNLSNKSISSAGTCGSDDIGYASTTSSENKSGYASTTSDERISSKSGYASTTSDDHVSSDGYGALSESTRASGGHRSSDKFKQHPAVAVQAAFTSSIKRHPETNERSACKQPEQGRFPQGACRAVSPTPSPKESAVPVPTRLCAGLALSPRASSNDGPLLMMPKANRNWMELEEEDAIGQPEQLDKMYNTKYNPHMNGEPSTTMSLNDQKVISALRKAEIARGNAMATIADKYKRPGLTPQSLASSADAVPTRSPASSPRPSPPASSPRGRLSIPLTCAPSVNAPASSPRGRFSIPSIWESGQVHGDLLSWFADELGVSKNATADIEEELIQTCRGSPSSGYPLSPQRPRDLVGCGAASPGYPPLSSRPPASPSPTQRPTSTEKPAPFASVLAARPPPVTSMVSEDMFAPEPRMV